VESQGSFHVMTRHAVVSVGITMAAGDRMTEEEDFR
jgi:hypothetical protein